MKPESVARINELARKKKAEGLSEAEQMEQDALRREYISAMKGNLRSQLETMTVIEPDGTRRDIRKKP